MLVTTTPIINLGTVDKGSTTDFTFNVTNNSTNPITLTVNATCGCTKPVLDSLTMKPLEMQYGKGSFRASQTTGLIQNKNIMVRSNNGDTLTIKITGNVL